MAEAGSVGDTVGTGLMHFKRFQARSGARLVQQTVGTLPWQAWCFSPESEWQTRQFHPRRGALPESERHQGPQSFETLSMISRAWQHIDAAAVDWQLRPWRVPARASGSAVRPLSISSSTSYTFTVLMRAAATVGEVTAWFMLGVLV